VTDFPARNKVAIVGYAQSMIERRSALSLGALTVRTVREAIADAGLKPERIDGFVTTPMFPSLGSHAPEDGVHLVTARWLAQHLGITSCYAESSPGQLPSAVGLAVNAIVAGAADYVVVHRALHNPAGAYHRNAALEARGQDQWVVPQGHFGPITAIALTYQEYVQRYNVADDALASVVIEARKNGARLPWSYWKDRPLGGEEYKAAPYINDPIRIYDCDIPVDGVGAFVLTSAERARDLPHRPVYVSGYAEVSPVRRRPPSYWPFDEVMELGQVCVERLCKRAGVASDEVDYLQVYDGFAPLAYFWMELAGLCPRGQAHLMAAEGGIDSDSPSAAPVLASGGALGNGRMHGIPQMLECYLQLSRRAGDRQRQVHVAMACQGVPHMGGAVLYASQPG
jgi:acetyl-CoA acetyltransferase